ncbi:hypothetical protein [Deinococcus alpinitundrae]|uniref:hypothetical protein n=1 Tax=Deinococcus alpinitundrae TaxID=468913 RepID=UPI001ED8CC4E|nr:hypothetical protein [Deinococcus alpinitundrae]
MLNRFRGDAALLSPGPEWLEAQTGVATVGVVPWLPYSLPEEDGFWVGESSVTPASGFVAIPRLPRVSNLDEFAPLGALARWITRSDELQGAQAIILPGSKATVADLDWLRRSGLAAGVSRAAAAGIPVLGICGGLQMLGHSVSDPQGAEGGGDVPGLGLLDLHTVMAADKTTRQTRLLDPETGGTLNGYKPAGKFDPPRSPNKSWLARGP